MLAPTIEPLPGAALDFAIAARDAYPAFLADLESRTGIAVALDRRGILELAHTRERARTLEPAVRVGNGLRWLGPDALRREEPALAPSSGAVLHPLDGAVDNVALLAALERATAAHSSVRRMNASVERITRSSAGAAVHLDSGEQVTARSIVLAAGAWSSRIEGLPRALHVEPARGQMLSVRSDTLGHVVYAEHVYLVPRPDERILIGATMEQVGFDNSTTPQALDALRRHAIAVAPALGESEVLASWAGLRPMTPDGLPVMGADPEWPSLLYACGHSRNGILMAPLTGECIAALAAGEEPSADLTAFDVRRFAGSAQSSSLAGVRGD